MASATDRFQERFEKYLRPFIEKIAPPGYREIDYHWGRIDLSWNRGGEVCQLHFNIGEGDAEITWSSSARGVTRATAALALYQAVLGFAAQLECVNHECPSLLKE